MIRRDPDAEARERAAQLPRHTWIIAQAPEGPETPYPCRCNDRPDWAKGWKGWECSAAFCPCAGRSDPQEPDCCGWRRSPASVVQAKALWDLKKRQEEEILD
jgi:hypothetical protein